MNGSTLRPARPDEAAALTALALRSKAVWGYSAAFMERCRPILAVSAASIAARPTVVAEADGAIAGARRVAELASPVEPGRRLPLLVMDLGTDGPATASHGRAAAASEPR